MKVVVSGDILEDPAVEHWKLHRLLSYACEGRHHILFDPRATLDRWLSTLDARTRDDYERAVALSERGVGSLPTDAATVRVELQGSCCWDDPTAILPLDDALAVLGERLGVLVENADNDWSFLLGIMRPSERALIQRWEAKGWLEALHGGGATLLSRMLSRVAQPAVGLRTFVMFDSDRLHPDELEPSWTPERPGLRPAACPSFWWEQNTKAKLPLRYWRLRRRYIESYMPKAKLQQVGPPDAVTALYGPRMTQAGRWYFNMKDGFDQDQKRHDKERCGSLYDGLQDTERGALGPGFGAKLADLYVQAKSSNFAWDSEATQEAAQALPRLFRLL